MPVYQELINFDEAFQHLTVPPIIINDLVTYTASDRDRIRTLIQSNFSPDLLSVLPSCQCGAIKGEFSIGELCEKCNTVVKPSIDESIEPLIWFRAPQGVAKLINPTVYILLRRRFNKGGFNVIHWLCDTSFRSQVKPPKVLDQILDLGIPRGYNNFVENFDYIYQSLRSLKEYNKKNNNIDYLDMLINEYRDRIFSDYLPLPNRSLLVIEKTYVGIYIDTNIIKAIDAINTVIGIDDPNKVMSIKAKENKTIRTIDKLADYYEDYTKENLAGKPGIFRKHVFGSRTHFSFRAVISSITDIHRYDDIYIPWGVGVSALRIHLMNKLLKIGYEHNQAVGYLNAHVEKYSPLLDNLFKELIAETPNGRGIPCIGQRNPSLLSGSAQLFYITKVKTDPRDKTVSISILCTTAPNADFDGDALNFILALDNKTARSWYSLAPHKNVLTLTEPRELSRNISIPKTVIASIANWANSREGYVFTEEQINKFNALPEV